MTGAFFSADPKQVLVALDAVRDAPVIEQAWPPRRSADGKLDPGTLASDVWRDQLAAVVCPPHVHPAAYAAIGTVTVTTAT